MSSVSTVGLTVANMYSEKLGKPLVQAKKLETEYDFISHLDSIGVLNDQIRSSLKNIRHFQSFEDLNQLAGKVNQYLTENNSDLGLRIQKWPVNPQEGNAQGLSVQSGDVTQLAIMRFDKKQQPIEGYAFGPKIMTVCESYNSQSNAHTEEVTEVTEMASGNAFKMPQRRISMISVGSLSSPECYEKSEVTEAEKYSFQSLFGGSNRSLSSDSSVSSPSGSVHSLENDDVRSASFTPCFDSDTEIQDAFYDMNPMHSANPWVQKDQNTHSETSVEPVMDNTESTVGPISPLPYVDSDSYSDSEDESIVSPASHLSAVVRSPVHAVSVEQTENYDAIEPDTISVTTGESHFSGEPIPIPIALVDGVERQDCPDIDTGDVLLMFTTPTASMHNPFFPPTDDLHIRHSAPEHSAPASPKNGPCNLTPHIQFDGQYQKETHLFQPCLPPLMISQHQSTQQINHSGNGLNNPNPIIHLLNQNSYLIDGWIDFLERSISSKMNELGACLLVSGSSQTRLLGELVELKRKDKMVKKLRTDRVKLQQPQPLNVFQPMVTPMNMPIHNSGYQSVHLAVDHPEAHGQMYLPQIPCNPYERVAPSYLPVRYPTTQQWHHARSASTYPAHHKGDVNACQSVQVLPENIDSINTVTNNYFDSILTPLPVGSGNALGFEGLNTPRIDERTSGKGNLFVFPNVPSAVVHPELQHSPLETGVISPASRTTSRANSPHSVAVQDIDTSITGGVIVDNRKRKAQSDKMNDNPANCKRIRMT